MLKLAITKICLLISTFITIIGPADAADFHFDKTNKYDGSQYSSEYIVIEGTIKSGDAKRFEEFLRSDTARTSRAFAIMLNSPGGSVSEAMSIGRLVRKLTFTVTNDHDAKCASSCFLIWAAGGYRRAFPDMIGVHRAFIDPRLIDNYSIDDLEKNYSAARLDITKYLDEMDISRNFQDGMLRIPSKEIHWLSQSDLNSIGNFPSYIEEFLIAKCDMDPATVRAVMDPASGKRVSHDAMSRAYDCLETLKRQQIAKHLGQKSQ